MSDEVTAASAADLDTSPARAPAVANAVAAASARPGPAVPRSRPWRRWALWTLLIGLISVAQGALLWLTRQYEHNRAQDAVEAAAADAASSLRRTLLNDLNLLQSAAWPLQAQPLDVTQPAQAQRLLDQAQAAIGQRRTLAHLEIRAAGGALRARRPSALHADVFRHIARTQIDVEAQVACANAQRQVAPMFSRTYFVPTGAGLGAEMVDACLPLQHEGRPQAALVATFVLAEVLDQALDPALLSQYEVSLVEADGARLARAGSRRGLGVYQAERLVDLPGLVLPLRAASTRGSPGWIPNLATALVLGLSLGLAGVVVALARDVRRRAQAERGLAEALGFRKAMEDSLVTGLRARDLAGRITAVNPAFCAMVGFSAEELIGQTHPPYWPPERAPEYAERQAERLSGHAPPREGYETTFMRRNGERFAVRVFEAPLVGADGQHTGWMSSVLDISEQRRAEETARQQQERLQATARLATLGEMATLLSHELNQPLAAISSYATGTLNLLDDEHAASAAAPPPPHTAAAIREAMERVAQQAERAGRVIKGVHDFVRRREHQREVVEVDTLIEGAMPLMRLAARRSGTRFELDLAAPPLRVSCDRTMVEQVLLNLVRNAIQAMESCDPPLPHERRVVTLRSRPAAGRWVALSVIDRGPGFGAEVARRMFTPLFTTKAEGMGMGLSLCRTVIEQHGGALEPVSPLGPDGGSEFRFTLPAAGPAGEPTEAS